MKISNFQPVNNFLNSGQTITSEHMFNYMGTKPHFLGVLSSSIYRDHTYLTLTEGIGNIFRNSMNKSTNKFQPINTHLIEWGVETAFLKKVEFADRPSGDGANGTLITMAFKENLYQKNDIFIIEGSRQQCMVMTRPIQKAANYFQFEARIVGNNFDEVLDLDFCFPGALTHFISNAHPEISEEGYVKQQTSTERFRSYITTFRNDINASTRHLATEEVYTKVEGHNKQKPDQTMHLTLTTVEKTLLDNFMEGRSMGLMLNKGNVDINGRPTIIDLETKQPIYIGDGFIPQAEKYANKTVYNTMTISVLNQIISDISNRIGKHTKVTMVFAVNNKLWTEFQELFLEKGFTATNNARVWSKAVNDFVNVGATYTAYEFAGNTIIFRPEPVLTVEYGDEKGFGILTSLEPNKLDNNTPAINLFSIKGREFISGYVGGVGGKDGTSSGAFSTGVAATKFIITGECGIANMNPYANHIIYQA